MATATVAAKAANPLDAVPDPTGKTIYFTAIDPALGAQVFKAPADGSATTPVAVSTGNTLAAPIGITISTDGNTLYVSDPGTITAASGTTPVADNYGAIYSVAIAGGAPAPVSGAKGFEVRGLDLSQVAGADTIFFTGRDKANGKPGVFSIPAAGGTPTVVAEGSPFVDPSGLAVATDGKIYVLDSNANPAAGVGTQTAQVFSIDTKASNAVATVGKPLAVGYPAGIAISHDQATLLISSLDAKRADGLFQITVATPANTASFAGTVVGTEAAGFHRAGTASVYAWVDTAGQVYAVK